MLLDAAVDRVEDRAVSDFDSAVAAVRIGNVISRDRKAAASWDRKVARRNKESVGLTGANLEAAVMALAATHSEYVVVGAR